jgi:hypothetical protein
LFNCRIVWNPYNEGVEEVMFLAALLICSTLEAQSCVVVANINKIWYGEAECQADAMGLALDLVDKGFAVRPYCFKVGENT